MTHNINLIICEVFSKNTDIHFEISYIDKFSVTITNNRHVELDGKKCKLGESAIASFWNMQYSSQSA